jgi:hypothetical protein
MSVFAIERQRSNGDWTPVGAVDTEGLLYDYPEYLLKHWLEANEMNAAPGRYRLIDSLHGFRSLVELLVSERREWTVERVEQPEPVTVGADDAAAGK